jgi:hypothetical protein
VSLRVWPALSPHRPLREFSGYGLALKTARRSSFKDNIINILIHQLDYRLENYVAAHQIANSGLELKKYEADF